MKRISFFNITGIALGLLTCSTPVALAADNVDLNALVSEQNQSDRLPEASPPVRPAAGLVDEPAPTTPESRMFPQTHNDVVTYAEQVIAERSTLSGSVLDRTCRLVRDLRLNLTQAQVQICATAGEDL